MRKFLYKYWLFLLSLFFFLSFLLYHQSLYKVDVRSNVSDFQQSFLKKENGLKEFMQIEKKRVLDLRMIKETRQKTNSAYFLHIYRNDSLIYWNTNKLPIINFSDIHFPSEGIVKLQNGWYYSRMERLGNVIVCASFLIKKEFVYENEFLKHDFAPEFRLPFLASIILDKENAYPIYSVNHNFVFALYPNQEQTISENQSNALVFLFLLGLAFFLFAVYDWTKNRSTILKIGLSIFLLGAQYFLIISESYNFLRGTGFFDASIYANSLLFPNLFVFFVNIIFICYGIAQINILLKKLKKGNKVVSTLLYVLSLLLANGMAYLFLSLVIDSSIPLEIEKLFKLNYYSLWASLFIGILFYLYYIFIRKVFLVMIRAEWKKLTLVFFYLISGVFYFVCDLSIGSGIIFLAIWPLLINGVVLINVLQSNAKIGFNYGVLLLLIFSFYAAININEFNDKKEKSERELFANQLASDQDISTELEFQQLRAPLNKEIYFQKIMFYNREIRTSEFKDFLERKYFNGFWERYACDFYLFDEDNKAIINSNRDETASLAYFEKILQKHSKISEIDSNVFYIKDYTSQLSYIAKLNIYNTDSSEHVKLYCIFKTKRIPEKIGFPRLLISENTRVFEPIENYAIAKYYNRALVSQNGKFSFPTREEALTSNRSKVSGYFDHEGYNHYLFRKNSRDLIILSKKLPSNFQLLTSFSYLFCFFGVFLLVSLVITNYKTFESSKLTFTLKIQLTLISIIVVALIAFGLGSGTFVSSQYNEYTNELIKEKIKAVQVEIKQKLGQENNLKIEKQGEYLSFILEQYAAVFVTDVNLYNEDGYLLASSRPKIYNAGLISEQINPEAFNQLRAFKKSEYIHQENIGNLNYLSAYMPLYNNDGRFLAYINLQHFGQQQGFENQIERFLVAIINVFILLLVFSVILAIFATNWVTKPLRVLRQNLAGIQLGKYNKPIDYQSNDEIGSLVKKYNQKLEELANTAEQLAIRERESAWREMAKQVAHEIKNPLTPMKLSLQHLQRIYDPNNPASKDKINQVVYSLIEQIDALTSIANEFSNFAKMPIEHKADMDLIPLINNTLLVFGQQNELNIEFKTELKTAEIFADKDLILRVFNNLIQNAIQSIPDGRIGKIEVLLSIDSDWFIIKIIDNGKGIAPELQHKIFVPNFTTKSTGTGLGLAMVKQIVELHQGKISFETQEDLGTIFTIEFLKSTLDLK